MFPNGSSPRPGTRSPVTAYLPAQPAASGTTPTLVTRWGITVLASVWMFILGILVGRQTVPLDVPLDPTPSELSRMAEREQKEDLDKMNGIVTSLENENAGFHEDLSRSGHRAGAFSDTRKEAKADDPKPDPKTPEVKRPLATKGTAPTVTQPGTLPSPPAAPPVAPKVSGRPSAPPIPEAEESALPAADGAGGTPFFGIQVASFTAAVDADAVVARLREKGYAGAYRIDESLPGAGVRYRVKIGYFGSRAAAQHTLGKLRQEEKLNDAYVFQRPD